MLGNIEWVRRYLGAGEVSLGAAAPDAAAQGAASVSRDA